MSVLSSMLGSLDALDKLRFLFIQAGARVREAIIDHLQQSLGSEGLAQAPRRSEL